MIVTIDSKTASATTIQRRRLVIGSESAECLRCSCTSLATSPADSASGMSGVCHLSGVEVEDDAFVVATDAGDIRDYPSGLVRPIDDQPTE